MFTGLNSVITVLPCTQHRWPHLALTPPRQTRTQFAWRDGRLSWPWWLVLRLTRMVHQFADHHPFMLSLMLSQLKKHSTVALRCLRDAFLTLHGNVVPVVHVTGADQWKLAIKRGHGGSATLRSHDYATTW